jgi:hypothetical protein
MSAIFETSLTMSTLIIAVDPYPSTVARHDPELIEGSAEWL